MHARPALLLGLLLFPSACQRAPAAEGSATPPAPRALTAEDVLRQAAAAHAAAPRTAAFTQVSTVTLASGAVTQRQRVVVQAPGRMRVDFLPLSSQAAAIYTEGRAVAFTGGRRVGAQDERNPLLLLGFSLYHQSAEATAAALTALGVRTEVMHRATHAGAPTWVIGATQGDTTANQVWIDAERNVPVRVIQSERRGTSTIVSDTRWSGHAEPYPTIPRTIVVARNGRPALRGAIEGVRVGLTLPAAAFDTTALRPIQP